MTQVAALVDHLAEEDQSRPQRDLHVGTALTPRVPHFGWLWDRLLKHC